MFEWLTLQSSLLMVLISIQLTGFYYIYLHKQQRNEQKELEKLMIEHLNAGYV